MLQWHLSREFFSDAKPQTPITEVKLCDKIVDPPKVWRFSQATLTIFQKRRDSISHKKCLDSKFYDLCGLAGLLSAQSLHSQSKRVKGPRVIHAHACRSKFMLLAGVKLFLWITTGPSLTFTPKSAQLWFLRGWRRIERVTVFCSVTVLHGGELREHFVKVDSIYHCVTMFQCYSVTWRRIEIAMAFCSGWLLLPCACATPIGGAEHWAVHTAHL